jgi:hypothetical protein
MGDTRLGIAVPVATPGSQQTELERDVGETRSEIGIVTRVTCFDRVEPLGFEPLDEGTRATLLQVGHRYQAADRMDQLGDGSELGQRFLDESWTAAAEKAIEGVSHIYSAALPHDGPRYMRTAHGAARRLLQYILKGKGYP